MKFFIINLKRSTQRKENLQKVIKDLFHQNPHLEKELKFHFFEAVDAKNNEHLAFKEYFNDFGSKLIRGALGESEKACFASHLSLWKKCLELDEPIFILEDDITFNEHFAKFILEFKHCPYEFVRLMSLKNPKTKPIDKHFEPSFRSVSGTQGYYLKPSVTLKLLCKAKFTFAIDDFIDRYYFHKVLTIIFKSSRNNHHYGQEKHPYTHTKSVFKGGVSMLWCGLDYS